MRGVLHVRNGLSSRLHHDRGGRSAVAGSGKISSSIRDRYASMHFLWHVRRSLSRRRDRDDGSVRACGREQGGPDLHEGTTSRGRPSSDPHAASSPARQRPLLGSAGVRSVHRTCTRPLPKSQECGRARCSRCRWGGHQSGNGCCLGDTPSNPPGVRHRDSIQRPGLHGHHCRGIDPDRAIGGQGYRRFECCRPKRWRRRSGDCHPPVDTPRDSQPTQRPRLSRGWVKPRHRVEPKATRSFRAGHAAVSCPVLWSPHLETGWRR